MYSRWNFAPWILSAGATLPTLSGPDRPGLRKSEVNPFDESDIYVATKKSDGTWSEPVNLGINGDFGDASGMELNNGLSFVWLQGTSLSNRIRRADRNLDGTWSEPYDYGDNINLLGSIVDNPHVSPDGLALWFVSNRAGGVGEKDIWFSFQSGGTWSTPVNAGTPFSSAQDDDQPFVSPVSMDVYWNGPLGLMHCISNGATCAAPPTVLTFAGCPYAAEASLPDDQSRLYFGCGDPATGRVKIMFAERLISGGWGPATPVD